MSQAPAAQAKKSKGTHGEVAANLFSFLDHRTDVIPDVMHQFFRTFERLLGQNGILGMALCNNADGEKHRRLVLDHFHGFGVHINFYSKEDGVDSTVWRHSTLTGVMLRKVLLNIDLSKFFVGEELVAQQLLFALYDRLMNSLHVDKDHALFLEPDKFHLLAKIFGRLYVVVANAKFTPYLHILVDHVHDFLREHGTIHQFSCQLGEFLHLVHKRFLQNNTMHDKTMKSLLRLANYEMRVLWLVAHPDRVPKPRAYKMVKRIPASTASTWCLRRDTLALLEVDAFMAGVAVVDKLVSPNSTPEQTARLLVARDKLRFQISEANSSGLSDILRVSEAMAALPSGPGGLNQDDGGMEELLAECDEMMEPELAAAVAEEQPVPMDTGAMAPTTPALPSASCAAPAAPAASLAPAAASDSALASEQPAPSAPLHAPVPAATTAVAPSSAARGKAAKRPRGEPVAEASNMLHAYGFGTGSGRTEEAACKKTSERGSKRIRKRK